MHIYEELPMNITGYALAAWLIGFHLWMIVQKKFAKEFLIAFPRNYMWGAVLMGIGMFWFWLLVMPGDEGDSQNFLSMDLGEFEPAKKFLLFVVPAAAYLMITGVKEFLAVRATGLLALMAAAPLLYSSFQDWPTGKILMPLYAYAMLTAGLFMVGMPYILRDVIVWVTKDDKRWFACAGGGLAYGVAVLVCSIFYWGGY